jgi:hypothetical protein
MWGLVMLCRVITAMIMLCRCPHNSRRVGATTALLLLSGYKHDVTARLGPCLRHTLASSHCLAKVVLPPSCMAI